jgi:hypothetical protein
MSMQLIDTVTACRRTGGIILRGAGTAPRPLFAALKRRHRLDGLAIIHAIHRRATQHLIKHRQYFRKIADITQRQFHRNIFMDFAIDAGVLFAPFPARPPAIGPPRRPAAR